jgi:hypothetical protein
MYLRSKSFISGGSFGWRVGTSPLLETRNEQESENQKFERDIHDRICDAGIFYHFANQPSALAYLNGQIMLRKSHYEKLKKLEKSLNNFKNSGVTKDT